MGERKQLSVAQKERDRQRTERAKGCRCGHELRACREYAHYTTGYCRRCGHARVCHKGEK